MISVKVNRNGEVAAEGFEISAGENTNNQLFIKKLTRALIQAIRNKETQRIRNIAVLRETSKTKGRIVLRIDPNETCSTNDVRIILIADTDAQSIENLFSRTDIVWLSHEKNPEKIDPHTLAFTIKQ